MWGWSNASTGCPESLHAWRCSKPTWAQPLQACMNWPCSKLGVGPDELQGGHPAAATLCWMKPASWSALSVLRNPKPVRSLFVIRIFLWRNEELEAISAIYFRLKQWEMNWFVCYLSPGNGRAREAVWRHSTARAEGRQHLGLFPLQLAARPADLFCDEHVKS